MMKIRSFWTILSILLLFSVAVSLLGVQVRADVAPYPSDPSKRESLWEPERDTTEDRVEVPWRTEETLPSQQRIDSPSLCGRGTMGVALTGLIALCFMRLKTKP